MSLCTTRGPGWMNEIVPAGEPQYEACFDVEPVTLGPMRSEEWRRDPKHMGFVLARYKFVAKMLDGFREVAEIGCGDGFASAIVRQAVGGLDLFDFDERFVQAASAQHDRVAAHDVRAAPLPRRYDGIYMLDVLEHLSPKEETTALRNVGWSLVTNGVFVAGIPSIESQAHASEQSRRGHVNCRTGAAFRRTLKLHFSNVFLFGMNDEVLHVGFAPMCHYLLAVCTGFDRTAS